MQLKKQRITFTIVYDRDNVPDPEDWNFCELLDLYEELFILEKNKCEFLEPTEEEIKEYVENKAFGEALDY